MFMPDDVCVNWINNRTWYRPLATFTSIGKAFTWNGSQSLSFSSHFVKTVDVFKLFIFYTCHVSFNVFAGSRFKADDVVKLVEAKAHRETKYIFSLFCYLISRIFILEYFLIKKQYIKEGWWVSQPWQTPSPPHNYNRKIFFENFPKWCKTKK